MESIGDKNNRAINSLRFKCWEICMAVARLIGNENGMGINNQDIYATEIG